MTDSSWQILSDAADLAVVGDKAADGVLNAVMETVADILPTAGSRKLDEGATAAARALALVLSSETVRVDMRSTAFRAGRLSAVVDILGYAAAATVPDEYLEKAAEDQNASVLACLASGPLTDDEITEKTQLPSEEVAKAVDELRSCGFLTSHRHSAKVLNVMTPAGLLAAESVRSLRSSG